LPTIPHSSRNNILFRDEELLKILRRSRSQCLPSKKSEVVPDFVRYKAASRAAREIFQRHTDLTESLSLDEATLT
jgi:hypothetical protein